MFPVKLCIHTYQLVYIVNDTNNKIYFEETEGVTLTATIANGNYNSSTLPLAIKTALQATRGLTYTITVASILTSKMTVSATGNFRFYNNSDKSLYPSSAHNLMGFDSESLEAFALSTRTGYTLLNLSQVDAVHISLGDVLNVEMLNNHGSTLVIPVDGNALDYINYSPQDSFQQYINFPKHTATLKVRVRDGDYNDLDLNGIDWFVVLERM